MIFTKAASLIAAISLALALAARAESITNKNSRTGPFILGAEVSWTQEDEADGAEYYDHGVKKDIFDILADRKINFIRLRLFVNPGATNGYAAKKSEAFCDLAHVKALAKRAKAHGMGLLLDIHYGDTWTSPGHQDKPGAWRDLSFSELTNKVHDYTRDVVTALRDNGTRPDMVQVGNEISDGMLFPDGSRSKPENFAALVGAGCRAVREIDPKIKIVLHHHLGRDNARMRPWIDNFLKNGVDFDIIGMSCYAQAQEGDWQRNFDDLATRYPDHGLLVVEYSGRKRFINELMFNTLNAKGWGTFIWEATRHREAIFDHEGANAGGGQSANFKSQETNAATATNVVAKAEPEKHGGRYDVNALADLYPQMAKDFVGIAPPHEILPPLAPALTNVTPYILTPPAPAAPRINGAKVFGVRPGSPFRYTIPATGERPMEFAVQGVPSGLVIVTNGLVPPQWKEPLGVLYLNPTNGQITGSIGVKREFTVTLRAKNKLGVAEKQFRIICGDTIALTPPMGWNSWNCFASAVSAEKVKAAADALVKAGLINHGWCYLNVDDFWQNHRNSKDATLHGEFRKANGEIQPNSRFPDMKGLADYIHSLGLKVGLYSSPGPWTCGGCAGSWQHEEQDAQTYAAWGFDYLKYDWCSYGGIAAGDTNVLKIRSNGVNKAAAADAVLPYSVMGKFLAAQKRDIVFSLCQYGMADVWKWGASVNGQSWRTTHDITDTWRSMSEIGFKQDKAAPFAGPGHWNDPDMLIIGHVGWGKPHPSKLTPDEQYTHISLWCLLAAPLLIGCDLEKLDEFTLSLLTNDEVLSLDQDSLGQQATCVSSDDNLRVYTKNLDDSGKAVGLFNLGNTPAKVVANWNDLKLSGPQIVRDLWRQKNLGKFDKEFSATVPPHGVVLVKLAAPK